MSSLRTSMHGRGEFLMLAAVVLAAFVIRVVRLGDFPDTFLGDEADNAQSAIRILYGRPPDNGFFGVDWTPQPAFSVYKEALFIAIFGRNVVAARLPSAVISAAALIPFYLLLRRQFSPVSSILPTMLLATDVWYLNFSRSGWNNIDIAFFMLMTMLFLLAGLDAILAEKLVPWKMYGLFSLAGFFCALGLYGYPAGRAIPLGVGAFLPAALLFYRRHWRTVVIGYAVLVGTAALLFAPQALYAVRNWEGFNRRSNNVLITNSDEYKADPAGTILNQLSNNLRGPWDGRVNNRPQYSPVGEPQLDRFTGALALAGMILTFGIGRLRRAPETWLWWLMLLCGWALTQLITMGTPNGARGIGYMPALVFFPGASIHELELFFGRLRIRAQRLALVHALTSGTAAACVLFASCVNVIHYVDWQSQPRTRGARYIYITTAEFPVWSDDVVQRALQGGGVTNLGQWRTIYPIQDVTNP